MLNHRLASARDGLLRHAGGVAAPAWRERCTLRPNRFGAVFSVAVFGLILDPFALGPIADRCWRRLVLIGAEEPYVMDIDVGNTSCLRRPLKSTSEQTN